MNREQCLDRAEKLVQRVQVLALSDARSISSLGTKRMQPLLDRSLKLKEQIIRAEDADPLTLDEQSAEGLIMDAENELARHEGVSRRIMGLGGVLIFLVAGVLLWIYGAQLQALIAHNFGVGAMTPYVILGIAGAVVYFVTDGLASRNELGKEGKVTLRRLIAHISFAVIIPVVIIVIFFETETAGEVTRLKGDPDVPAILCFSAGYSSKLVVMLLNKIVEKGEKIIQAL